MRKVYPRKWYPQKVLLLDEERQKDLNELKNELMSYEGVRCRTTKYFDTFIYKNRIIAKLGVSGKIIRLFLDLEPGLYDKNQFPHKDMSHQKRHRNTPFLMRVYSKLSLRRGKGLINDLEVTKRLQRQMDYEQQDYISVLKEIDETGILYQ